MFRFLEKIYILNKHLPPSVTHKSYGILSGFVGIGFNLLLFAFKLLAGWVSGSIAIMADGFNNLSDAGSSLTTLICFRLAGQKPDSDHPFGHGRFEYIAGLIVSMVIFVMGFELAKSAVDKIINGSEVVFSIPVVIILVLSIGIKFYMYRYNTYVYKKTGSLSIKAASMDSISDCVATSAVLLSVLLARFVGLNADGYFGLAVALFILFNGYKTIRETITPLLGQQPDPQMVLNIRSLVMAHPEVEGIHDLVIHDYGPGRSMISLHVEVDANSDFITTHDAIDNIEHELSRALECKAVIHMDPIVTDDEQTNRTCEIIKELVHQIDEEITVHDFRMVPGPTHTNLVFDVAAPFSVKLTDSQIKYRIEHLAKSLDQNYTVVVTIDRILDGQS